MQSRELRFRVWSNEKCFKYENNNYIEINGCYISTDRLKVDMAGNLIDSHREKVIIEQYIGLCDKNGIPIYENDIIEATYIDYDAYLDEYATHYPSERTSGTVSFEKGRFVCGRHTISNLRDIKIIGNIHQ